MDIVSIAKNLMDFGNCVCGVSELQDKKTGIADLIAEYDIEIAKVLEPRGDWEKPVVILRNFNHIFTKEEIKKIQVKYLQEVVHRHVHVTETRYAMQLKNKDKWEIQSIAAREFGVKDADRFMREVLEEVITADLAKLTAEALANIEADCEERERKKREEQRLLEREWQTEDAKKTEGRSKYYEK